MDLVDLINSRRFLGSEFLIYLWFRVDCYDGLLDVEDIGRIELIFDDQLTLDAYVAETQRNDLRGGAPAYSLEAVTALRQGKRPTKAKLCILREGREWTFTFKAETFQLTSVKIPALLTKETVEQFYERMYLLEELEDILHALYREFLEVRLGDMWEERFTSAMKAWIDAEEDPVPEDFPT
jgi:hypothetical protein